MPSGVEHRTRMLRASTGEEGAIAVSMPSGVEHLLAQRDVPRAEIAIAVSMPSGVEHTGAVVTLAGVAAGDRRLDALGR